jgi:glutamate dehydrogenase
VNGTLGSTEATGTGAYYVTKEVVKDLGLPAGARVAIQGFGNVGRNAALLLHKDGFKVVAVGDIYGGIYSPEGIDVEKLVEHVNKTGSVVDFPGTSKISTMDVLEVDCEILLPAAVQSVITEKNAAKVKAKLIMECANGPVTPEGEAILEERGVTIVPDVLTNCGSAIVCSFERTQGLTDTYWDLETVLEKLRERITKAYRETAEAAKKYNTTYRYGAWINALTKIGKAMKFRGWI